MTRIRIVGGVGSGKSYLAKRLSKHLAIQAYDLDDIFWENKATYGKINEENIRTAKLRKITTKKKWIIEGVYSNTWVHSTFTNADTIILVKTSKIMQTRRVIGRFLKRKLSLIESKKESLWDLFKLLKWNLTTDAIQLFKKRTAHLKINYLEFNDTDEAFSYFTK